MSTASGHATELTAQEKRVLLAQLLQQKAQPPTFPLSYGQQALWLTHQLAPESWTYHVVFSVWIRSEVDLAALQRAFQALSERHPVLRTTYSASQGTPEQKVQTQAQMAFAAIDASDWSQDALSQRLLVEVRQPFDLERGPVMRVRLLTRSAREHLLVLVVHHIAIDMWSLGVLLDELRVLYPAEKTGVPASLPALERYYVDYVRQQADMLAGVEGERLWAFWQQQLAGVVPVLQLPTDWPRPPVQTYAGVTHTFTLSAQLTEQLKALAQAESATLYTLLLAAFDVLLYRYTGQEDILVGAPMANRMQPEYRRVVGYFVNPVVLRAQIVGDASFRAFLGQARDTVRSALEHQNYPFALLVERLQPPRDASRSPLFQVMFVLQQLHGREELLEYFAPGAEGVKIDFGGLVLEPLALPQQEGQFDLTLEMAEVGESLLGGVKYNTDLFDAATICRMARHLQTLLEGIVANPDQPLAALPLLTATEQQQVLGMWPGRQTTQPQPQCLHQLFEAQVECTPDAIAVVYEAQHLTYRELNRSANRLAHYLQSLGIGPEVLVGICMEHSLEMIIGLLGILKAGGAYVPLDPVYPLERLAFMLKDAQITVLLTQERLMAQLPTHRARVVCLDTEQATLARQPETNPSCDVTADNVVYVIYTSGSTGTPKGVMVSHHNVVRLFIATHAWFHFDPQDVWTLFHSYAFDFSVWELWGALVYGGRLVVLPFWITRSPAALYDLLWRERVTVLNQTPSAFRQLMQATETLGDAAKELDLRLIIFGGETLEVQSLQPWFGHHGDRRPQLVNMYGITETTIHVTYCPLTATDAIQGLGSPIGIPIPDLQVSLLDACLNPVPIGVPGELYIGGAGVARGYLNRPDLTAQRFILHPFSTTPGARLYKSGDLARYRPDGSLEYLGRIDQQVKIRGFRIELGEVEAVLAQHPAIREVVVLAREQPPGHAQLVAYVVGTHPPLASQSALRAFLRQKLPDYMIPGAFVELDALPLTRNGKIDRWALPAPPQDRPELDKIFVAPRNPTEATLADIWCQTLGLAHVGMDDAFFDLGGDSIRALQVQSQARDRGLHLSLQHLLQQQTIAALARVISTEVAEATVTPPALSLLAPEDSEKLSPDVEDAYPLTTLQTEMLFYSQAHPDSSIYHVIFSYHVRVDFDLHAWETALAWLAARHAILRTSFALTRFSMPLQQIHRTARIPLAVQDLRHLPAPQQEEALRSWIESEKTRPIDWTTPPLLRTQIHRRTEATWQLTLSFHHAIFDGWSVASMLTELMYHYLALLHAAPVPPASFLAASFRDFVAQERRVCNSTAYQQYWQQWQRDRARRPWYGFSPQPTETPISEDVEIVVAPQLVSRLQHLARTAAVPLKSVLLAAHLKVIGLLSGQSEVLTGLVSHGRPEAPDAERVLGLFLNILPLRLSLSGCSWTDLVQATFKAERELIAFRYYPFPQSENHKGGFPLFETVFNFTHFHVYQNLVPLKDFEYLGGTFFDPFPYTLKANFIIDPLVFSLSIVLNYNKRILHNHIHDIGNTYIDVLIDYGKE